MRYPFFNEYLNSRLIHQQTLNLDNLFKSDKN